MPTIAELEAAATTLSALAQAQWQTLIRMSAQYKEESGLYPNLTQKLASATAIQARQLNAALAVHQETGDGTVQLQGGADAVNYDQVRDKDEMVRFALSVLYDQPVRAASVQVGKMRAGVFCPRCYPYACRCGY